MLRPLTNAVSVLIVILEKPITALNLFMSLWSENESVCGERGTLTNMTVEGGSHSEVDRRHNPTCYLRHELRTNIVRAETGLGRKCMMSPGARISACGNLPDMTQVATSLIF